jgi:hypothetical protein
MLLEKTKIYGVDGVGQSSPTLTRTDSAVGLTYTIGASEIESDFDRCFPWCEMKEVTDDYGNVFIYIPKFYTKITKNSNGTYKHQISGCRYDGFGTLFIDGKGNEIDYVLVGKYEGGYDNGKLISKSGQTIKVNITLPATRKACQAVGAGYQQYDFLIDWIIKELFTIEFATTNSQSIMKGFTASTNTAALITGHTDNVKTPSGSWNNNHDLEDDEEAWTDSSCNTDGIHACKYRGIENPWGNTWTWCDGINFKNEKIYICESPTEYASDKYDAPYTYVGNRNITDGYVKTITPFAKNPLLGYSTIVGSNESTYYCDYNWSNKGLGTVLRCGGGWYYGSDAGLWCWSGYYVSSFSYGSIGGRLCFKPL